MKKSFFTFIQVTVLVLTVLQGFAQDKEVRLTSLEWPPYTGKDLSGSGANAEVVKAAFKAVGYDLKIDFFPWVRAVNSAKSDPEYSGYFPEYYFKEGEKDFFFSGIIGKGPLGFVENKETPVSWKTLDDLKDITVGTVKGYVNTVEFDDRVARGELKVDAVVDDLTNLKKVARGRIRMAVIDKYVMKYLLATDASLAKDKEKLQFNANLLEEKGLHICFRKDEQGEKMNKLFNEGLKKIDVDKIMKDYFDSIFSK